MKRIPFIKSVMTPFPHSIEKAATLADADRLMREHDIHHLPVMDGGTLVSVIGARELEHAMETAGVAGPGIVADLCRGDAYTVDLKDPLDEVLSEMADRHADAAVVLKDGKLAGIFTYSDACRTFSSFLRGFFPAGDDEDAA
jgi:CBS domain-containing protein